MGNNEQHLLTAEINEQNEKIDNFLSENEKIKKLKEDLKNTNMIPTGKVLGFTRRNMRNFCGELDNIIDGFCLVNLVDSRYGQVVIKPTHPQQIIDKKIMVAIDEWPEGSKYPLGHLV